MESPEDELIELPSPPLRVTVTPEWLAEQRDKQRRYQQARKAWREYATRPEE